MTTMDTELPPAGARVGRRDPDVRGYFGTYGGRFVPETLVAPVEELQTAYFVARSDRAFQDELTSLLDRYVGRPTPVSEAVRWSEQLGGARLLRKREDLAHTGAHKINNALGQALLAVRMGKRRVVAETGAGQHGVATATACARLDLTCEVYMGAEDMERQALNVVRMRLLGARVTPVAAGARTLKDAINEAMRDWVTNIQDTYYLLGSVLGPHPYPLMVRESQSVIGAEARQQVLALVTRSWRAGMPHDLRPERSGSCRAHGPSSCRTRTATSRRRIPCRPVSTTQRSGRSTPGCATWAARRTPVYRTTRRSRRSCRSRDWKASSRPSNRPMRWHTPGRSRRNSTVTKSSSSTCLGAGTRMLKSSGLAVSVRPRSPPRDHRGRT